MPARPKLPDFDVLRELVAQGLTDAEIGERYGASGEAVRQKRMRAKPPILRPSEKGGHKQYVPWKVRNAHRADKLHLRLVWYSTRQQRRQIKVKNGDKLLDEWLQYMDGANPWGVPLVVNYSHDRGFWLEPKRDGDQHYIRRPENG